MIREPKLHAKRGFWQVVFTLETKDRFVRKWYSTGTKVRHIAEKRRLELYHKAIEGEFDPSTGSYRSSVDAPSLREASNIFQEDRGRQWTQQTARDYRNYLNLLVTTLGADRHLDDIRSDELDEFHLQDHLATATRRNYYRRSHAFLKYCQRKKWLSGDFIEEITVPKADNNLRDFLRKEEYLDFIRFLEKTDRFTSILVQLAVSTGLRSSELALLEFDDIDYQSRSLEVKRGKGGRNRFVPLFPMTEVALRRVSPFGQYVLGKPSGTAYTNYDFSHRFKDAARAFGLRESIRLHSLRHTYASWLAMEGVALLSIRDWMGHSTYSVTEKYAKLIPLRGMGSEPFYLSTDEYRR